MKFTQEDIQKWQDACDEVIGHLDKIWEIFTILQIPIFEMSRGI